MIPKATRWSLSHDANSSADDPRWSQRLQDDPCHMTLIAALMIPDDPKLYLMILSHDANSSVDDPRWSQMILGVFGFWSFGTLPFMNRLSLGIIANLSYLLGKDSQPFISLYHLPLILQPRTLDQTLLLGKSPSHSVALLRLLSSSISLLLSNGPNQTQYQIPNIFRNPYSHFASITAVWEPFHKCDRGLRAIS
jgi:hypothetical protein